MLPKSEFLGTVDTDELSTTGWPILRVLFPQYVQEMQLGRYVRGLLSAGGWQAIRLEPRLSSRVAAQGHVFEVYGVKP